ncbi:MAG: hypothetical protein KDE50_13085, partial [Caldilineaceae bacterium]|nr:hypothetical protein [Caldilineaceae bacterium]
MKPAVIALAKALRQNRRFCRDRNITLYTNLCLFSMIWHIHIGLSLDIIDNEIHLRHFSSLSDFTFLSDFT